MADVGIVRICLGAAGQLCRVRRRTANDVRARTLKYFETHVRPLLIEKCYKCHSDKKQSGELRLDSREGALTGGESGPAVVVGNLSESL